MATALAKLRGQVMKAFLDDRAWRSNAGKLQRGLRRKFDRLVPQAVALPRRPWTADVETFVNHHLDDPIVDLLLLRTADLRFFVAQLAGSTNRTTVFAAADGNGVESYRDSTTFLINVDGDLSTASWSRCVSISRRHGANAYPKHLHVRTYRGSDAKYGSDVLPREVESLVVRHGIGHFVNDQRLYMYARFANAVGMTGRIGARVETHVLKVQLDKVRRPTASRLLKDRRTRKRRQDGWEIHMHGYPISNAELQNDFPVGAARVLRMAIGS